MIEQQVFRQVSAHLSEHSESKNNATNERPQINIPVAKALDHDDKQKSGDTLSVDNYKHDNGTSNVHHDKTKAGKQIVTKQENMDDEKNGCVNSENNHKVERNQPDKSIDKIHSDNDRNQQKRESGANNDDQDIYNASVNPSASGCMPGCTVL